MLIPHLHLFTQDGRNTIVRIFTDEFAPTDSEISVTSDQDLQTSESLLDRVAALIDIIPPSTRGKISSTSSSIASFTGSALSFTGKGLWVVSTSVLLLGIPYALAFGQEQEIMEREREEGLMREGASSVSWTAIEAITAIDARSNALVGIGLISQ
jgi:mitochondrial import receptor subunit TOM22